MADNSTAAARPTRVLLVDDDELVYLVIEDLLAQIATAHYELDWTHDPDEALQALTGGAHDVFLLDYRLGEADGLELLQAALRRGCQAPVIMLTGEGDREVDVQAMRLGAADYLVKGEFGAQTLERAIRYAVERWRTLARLRESEERYMLATRGANDGIWDWQLGSDRIYYSPRWQQMLGYQEGLLQPEVHEWFDRVHPEDLPALEASIQRHLAGTAEHFECEYRMLHHDGDYRWMLCRGAAIREADAGPSRMAGSQTDITRRAAYDALTGLPNRALFLDRLERAISHCRRREDEHFAVLFCDLDRFKIINDSLGHVIGDELLVAVARRLKEAIRESDTVARLGGDEFTLLLIDVADSTAPTRVAKRILRALSAPFILSDREVFISGSVGIAIGPNYDRPEDVLRDADTAMYRAKALGRARYEIFDDTMHKRAMRTLHLEADLRRDIEQGNLVTFYQPIVELERRGGDLRRRITGFEALVRWRRRGGELLLPPGEFIDLAEEAGLLAEIDRVVREAALAQLKQWRQRFTLDDGFSISVNISLSTWRRPNLLEELDEQLAAAGATPAALTLELCETVIIGDSAAAAARLQALRERGFRLALDDFGTGHSSLSYLHQLPFDVLKIDRSFAANLVDQSSAERAIVEAIVQLALKLGLSVTAEGVETDGQLEVFGALGCRYIQGYLLSRPLPAGAATEYLARSLGG